MTDKKQARLPFKLLDHQPAAALLPSHLSKKRKHSDDDTMCKTTRTNGSKLVEKKVTPSKGSNKVVILDENEVTSSSESENALEKKNSALTRDGLLKFFCPAQQQEVSTSSSSDDVSENKSAENELQGVENKSSDDVIILEEDDDEVVDKDDLIEETDEKETEDSETATTSALDVMDGLDDSVATETSLNDTSDVSNIAEEKNTSLDDEVAITDVTTSKSMSNKRSLSATSLNQDGAKVQKTQPSTPSSAQKKPVVKNDQERTDKLRLKEEARLEREKKKQELKDVKQAEKDRKEKERLEKKDQLEKDKLDKQKAREDEKRKKQEALETEKVKKEEERKKKLEEKEQEKLKKDEEKQKKEEEKLKKDEEKKKEEEELEMKKAKKAAVFRNFFTKTEKPEVESTVDECSGPFLGFSLKEGMVLAPQRRQKLVETGDFDQPYNEQCSEQKLYLAELKSGRNSRRCAKTISSKVDEDVIIVGDDAPDFYKTKFLKFKENNRPAFYGTFRKSSGIISGRHPLEKDEKLFDYEVDSDDEWEEEEPGESLSNSEGEDEEDKTVEANDDDEDEDGFFVPHGYLSDGEGCDDDDEITPEKMKAKQIARQRAFEVELKKQCKKLIPVVVGCCFEFDSLKDSTMRDTLSEFQCVSLHSSPFDTSYSKAAVEDEQEQEKREQREQREERRVKRLLKPVPDEAMPDLIRLFHGNVNGNKKLIHEFRVYWKNRCNSVKTETNADKGLETASAMETDEPVIPKSEASPVLLEGVGVISKRQLEMKVQSIADYKWGKYFRKCWYVKDEVLKQYNLENLSVPSEWVYTTKVETVKKEKEVAKESEEMNKTPISKTPVSKVKQGLSIKKFVVNTTSDDLFTSPSVSQTVKPSSIAKSLSGGTNAIVSKLVASPVASSAGGNKTIRRVQLTTLGAFMKPVPSSQVVTVDDTVSVMSSIMSSPCAISTEAPIQTSNNLKSSTSANAPSCTVEKSEILTNSDITSVPKTVARPKSNPWKIASSLSPLQNNAICKTKSKSESETLTSSQGDKNGGDDVIVID